MIDNLKDAITHAREVEIEQRRRFEDIYGQEEQTEAERKEAIACLDCSNEHGQLVAWLEELQARRDADKWSKWVITEIQCPNCLEFFDTICYSSEELKKCPSCGATMKGGAV